LTLVFVQYLLEKKLFLNFKIHQINKKINSAETNEFSPESEANYQLIGSTKIQSVSPIYEVIIERRLDTCDPTGRDYVIQSGTVHLIHFKKYARKSLLDEILASGKFEPYLNADQAEMKQAQLIKSEQLTPFDERTRFFDVFNSKVNIPDQDTTYWCLAHKLDPRIAQSKHHIVAFEGIVTPNSRGVVHHMELFYCMYDPVEKEMKRYNAPCTSEGTF
jgi:hypothetical protein